MGSYRVEIRERRRAHRAHQEAMCSCDTLTQVEQIKDHQLF